MRFYRILVPFVLVCGFVTSITNSLNSYELLDDASPVEDVRILANPIAVLVDDSPENFKDVLQMLQRDAFRESDLWLVTFNSSGVSTVWEKTFSDKEQFYSTLQRLAAFSNSKTHSNGSLPVFALLHTAKILPKNSAVIVFSQTFLNEDKHLENEALNLILNKNITVFTVNENEEQTFLKNIREYSGGRKLGVTAPYESYKLQSYATPSNVSMIFSRKNLQNQSEVMFPVDSAVTAIHVITRPSVYTKGVLISPTGYTFSFSNKTNSNTIKYSRGSLFENKDGYIEIHLNFTTSSRPTVGPWTLKLENMQQPYNVTVFAFTKKVVRTPVRFPDVSHETNTKNKDVSKLGVAGDISHITDISLLDSNGETLLRNVSYKFNNGHLNYVTQNSDNVPDTENKSVDVEINKLRLKPYYALIRGKDVNGHNFQRLSYIFGKSDIYPTQSIIVEVGLGSELYAASGRRAEIYFEVTNQGTTAQHVIFTCSDSRYILHSLSSYTRYLEPQESTIATLYLITRSGTYQDEITFTVRSGFQVVQKKVLVDVGSQITDQNPPELTPVYKSDCTEVLFSQCSKGTWTLEITARDVDSGLMQLNTLPKGLYISYGYTSGTKDSVTGHYSDSCCRPDLQITAVDRLNNRRSLYVNAYYATLSPGIIAAIVLGVILFIILVTVIVIVSVNKCKCRCKAKESYDLPTYRGGGI